MPNNHSINPSRFSLKELAMSMNLSAEQALKVCAIYATIEDLAAAGKLTIEISLTLIASAINPWVLWLWDNKYSTTKHFTWWSSWNELHDGLLRVKCLEDLGKMAKVEDSTAPEPFCHGSKEIIVRRVADSFADIPKVEVKAFGVRSKEIARRFASAFADLSEFEDLIKVEVKLPLRPIRSSFEEFSKGINNSLDMVNMSDDSCNL